MEIKKLWVYSILKPYIWVIGVFIMLVCGPWYDIDEYISYFLPESAYTPKNMQGYRIPSHVYMYEQEDKDALGI